MVSFTSIKTSFIKSHIISLSFPITFSSSFHSQLSNMTFLPSKPNTFSLASRLLSFRYKIVVLSTLFKTSFQTTYITFLSFESQRTKINIPTFSDTTGTCTKLYVIIMPSSLKSSWPIESFTLSFEIIMSSIPTKTILLTSSIPFTFPFKCSLILTLKFSLNIQFSFLPA